MHERGREHHNVLFYAQGERVPPWSQAPFGIERWGQLQCRRRAVHVCVWPDAHSDSSTHHALTVTFLSQTLWKCAAPHGHYSLQPERVWNGRTERDRNVSGLFSSHSATPGCFPENLLWFRCKSGSVIILIIIHLECRAWWKAVKVKCHVHICYFRLFRNEPFTCFRNTTNHGLLPDAGVTQSQRESSLSDN